MFGDELANYHFSEQHPFGPKRYWAFKEEFDKRKSRKNILLKITTTSFRRTTCVISYTGLHQ